MIGMGLSVASSAMQASAQQQMVNAQNKANRDAYEISKRAREAEQVRQAAFEKQASDNWTSTLNQMDQQRYNDAKQTAENQFMQQNDALPSALNDGQLLSGQEYASDAVKTEIAQRSNKAATEARSRIKALAALTGADAASLGRNFNLSSNADQLGTINSLRRGSLGVSNQEQNISPAQVSQGSSVFGDVLSGIGGIMTQRGAYNAAVNG